MCLDFILFLNKFLRLNTLRTKHFSQVIQKNVLYNKRNFPQSLEYDKMR